MKSCCRFSGATPSLKNVGVIQVPTRRWSNSTGKKKERGEENYDWLPIKAVIVFLCHLFWADWETNLYPGRLLDLAPAPPPTLNMNFNVKEARFWERASNSPNIPLAGRLEWAYSDYGPLSFLAPQTRVLELDWKNKELLKNESCERTRG